MRPPLSADERVLRRSALRIGVQTVAAVGLTVMVLTAIGVLVVLNSQHSAQTDMINTALARADDVDDPPAGMWLVIRRAGVVSASPGLPPGFPDQDEVNRTSADGAARSADVVVGEVEYRVTTRPYGTDGVVQAVLDLSADHAQRSRLIETFLLIGAAGLVIAALVGIWLARRAIAPMAEALALQRRFVADAGHELRTPLTLVSTRAQLIQRSLTRGADPKAIESDVDSLVREAGLLAGVLDDLLLTADQRTAPEPVDLSQLVADVVDSARLAAAEHQVTVTLADAAGVTVLGTAASVRRAMNALLDNAVRHAHTEVRVTVAVRGRNVVVDVTDDGPGIDPGILPTLFARFATTPADGARNGSRRYGLGLALVSEIATRHGGSITVVRTGADGATFRLLLPAANLQENSQNPPAG